MYNEKHIQIEDSIREIEISFEASKAKFKQLIASKQTEINKSRNIETKLNYQIELLNKEIGHLEKKKENMKKEIIIMEHRLKNKDVGNINNEA
jgi:predicted glycosyltransferase involved in capsule biosynthesis